MTADSGRPYFNGFGWRLWSYYGAAPRNYTSRNFVEEWENQDPDLCSDDLDSEICKPSIGFSESILLHEGMDMEEVTRVLGTPIQKIQLSEKEIWEFSSFSLLFEFGRLKEIR